MIPDSPRKLAGQALIAGFPGQEPDVGLLGAAARGELGGFVLFRRNLGPPDEVAALTGRLWAAFPADLPPWIAIDQEGGRVQRLGPPVLQLPPMRVLGAIDDQALTRSAGALLGAQLAALGVNLDFAPVLDVDSNPDSPIIGDRSFGADPELCARHGIAFAEGLRQAGVASCGKHFPGHGDAALDSHLALPRVSHDLERLQRVELRPFALAAKQLTAIMTAHIVFDAVDPGRPATLSHKTLQGLLRGQIGFAGVLFSDDLLMKAIADHYGVAEAACEAVAAGCDAVLVCAQPDICLQAHAALCRRAEREPAFLARLREAAVRSLPARAGHALRPLARETVAARLHALDPGALEQRIAEAAERHVRAAS
ncbi:MAG: beta-N-acetylhexosaminidase [Polyangiales bacterium]